jgi:hypothetical protein
MDVTAKLGVVAAVSGGAWAMFKALEETASAEARSAMSAWLKTTSLSADRTETIHRVFYKTFQSAFGSNPFSKKFIVASIAMSTIGIVALYVVLLPMLVYVMSVLSPDEFANLWSELKRDISKDFSEASVGSMILDIVKSTARLVAYFGLVVFACWIVDYLSLVKSSFLIALTQQTKAFKRAYAMDLLITLLLSLGWAVLWGILSYSYKNLFGVQKLEYNPVPYIANGLISAWVPTLLLGGFISMSVLAKAGAKLLLPAEFLRSKVLAIDEKPFQSVGVISALLLLPCSIAYVALVT